MVRPASLPLPARYSFAKVLELGSWAFAWGPGARDRGRPGEPAWLSASPQTSRALGLGRHAATYSAGLLLQPTLFLALPRDMQTRPVFDLGDSAQLECRGHLARSSIGDLVSFFLLWKLRSAGCPVTSLSSLQNQLAGDRSLLARAILRHIQDGGLGLPSSPKCASGHGTQNTFPKPSVLFFLEFKPSASAHSGPFMKIT